MIAITNDNQIPLGKLIHLSFEVDWGNSELIYKTLANVIRVRVSKGRETDIRIVFAAKERWNIGRGDKDTRAGCGPHDFKDRV